jgi:D-psicose/D-tagatose/L-ribulose 3-epimerase
MTAGFNLLLWTTHVTDQHLPLLAALKAAGYDGVEVPVFEGEVAHFRKLGQAVRDHGLACTSVTVLPDAEHSAIHPDPKSRQGALDHLAWALGPSPENTASSWWNGPQSSSLPRASEHSIVQAR